MKGLFAVAPGRLEVLELPQPEPGPYEALVQTEACAICNSTDTKLIHGQFFSGTWPLLLGHESVGRVVKMGEGVQNFRVGDRVLRGSLSDSHIPFPGGRSCWGGFAEYNLVTDVWAREGAGYNAWPHPQQIVPQHIGPCHAATLITLKENLSLVSNFNVAGRSLAIVGTGPVAQAMTLFARLLGATPIVVFGRHERWRERFLALGADGYVAGDSLPDSVRAILAQGGFERVIEAVGSQAALSRCMQLVGPEGRVGIYGIPPEDEPYSDADMADPRVSQPKVAEAEVHDQLLAMVARGQVNLADWVSHVLPWQEFRRGFEMIWNKEANKVVLAFA